MPKEDKSTPPWGTDEEFSPQKAWDLIQNLRKDVQTAKDATATAVASLKTVESERDAARKDLEAKDDATKSESEKLTEKLAAMEKDLEGEKANRLRAEVVAAKGLSPAQAKRLSGATKEELEADADELLEAFPTEAGPKGPPSTRPGANLAPGGTGGTDPTSQAEKIDIAKLADAIPRP
jgi:hypothetical protein